MDALWIVVIVAVVVLLIAAATIALQRRRRSGSVLTVDRVQRTGGSDGGRS